MLDDSRTIIGATLLTLGYDVNTSDPTELAAAKAKLLELTPNVRLFDSDSPKTALIGGDADLGIVWRGEAFLAHAENDQIAYVYPSEGTILFQDNFAILADAPHADAAYAWLNYLYQPTVHLTDKRLCFKIVNNLVNKISPATTYDQFGRQNHRNRPKLRTIASRHCARRTIAQ